MELDRQIQTYKTHKKTENATKVLKNEHIDENILKIQIFFVYSTKKRKIFNVDPKIFYSYYPPSFVYWHYQQTRRGILL